MGTKVNRAESASSKTGGNARRRNKTTRTIKELKQGSTRKRRTEQRERFMEHRRETKARMRQGIAGLRSDFTPPYTRPGATPDRTPVPLTTKKEHARIRRHGKPSGRGMSAGKIFPTGTRYDAEGRPSARRPKPSRRK